MLVVKLAWRNVFRNKTRSFLTIAAVAFGLFLMIFMRGMQLGTYEVNIKNAIEMFPGYIQIQYEGYRDNPTLQKCFTFTDEMQEKVLEVDGVKHLSQRIISEGLIGHKKKSYGAAIFGIDPEAEANVSTMHTRLDKGRFLKEDNRGEIVVGYKLLENLGSKIGDELVVLSSGFDGSMGNMKFKVVGTTKTGTTELDASSVYMHIEDANNLFSMYGMISMVAVKLENVEQVSEVQHKIANVMSNYTLRRDKKAEVLNWEEVLPEFKQMIEFDNASGMVYLGLLMIIIAFGILNTVVMSISERFSEFGVMLALGTKNSLLVMVMFVETIFIAIIGMVFGTMLGYFANAYVVSSPIELTGPTADMIREYGFIPAMYSTLDPWIFLNANGTVLLISILVYIYPAFRLSKLQALKGIRYV